MPTLFHENWEVPILETDRLRLRGHRLEDFLSCAALWADPIVTRYTVGKPLSGEDVWARMLRYVGHWAWMAFGPWVIEEKATGNFVGEMGFVDWKRDIQPSLRGIPELGWVLASQAHGQGYATESVRAALAWGKAHFTSTAVRSRLAFAPELISAQMVCIIHPDNVRSIRVAEKCGFREVLRTTYKDQPTILYAQ